MTLVAPFPWFGGKRRVAQMVWERFGTVQHYVEPFFGSGAVLLGAPRPAKVETVNDLDGFVANFWRAVQWHPGPLSEYADWPVNEADLHARHAWLIEQRGALTEKLRTDPQYCDAEIAAWWAWGIGLWIGDGWSRSPGRQLPILSRSQNVCPMRSGNLRSVAYALEERLRFVRVACGDWSRIVTPAVRSAGDGVCGVFLDPPYTHGEHRGETYGAPDVAADVAAWAREHGDDPATRIALCGYEGEHDMPGWKAVQWKANGGYGNASNSDGRANARRETIWFSPHCLSAKQLALPMQARINA